MTQRKIIHLDLDAFFCAVEELSRPDLRGKPFAVGGSPTERGVVSSCSYAARQKSVRSAMPMARALNLCPELIVVSSNFSAYRPVSEQVMSILGNMTPLVEQLSIDEAFLDVSDLPQSGFDLARSLQAQIQREVGVPCSIGVATNKLVAKTATDVAKASYHGSGYPNAILEVPAGEEAAFMAALPVQSLWGVGPKTATILSDMGIRSVADLARQPVEVLKQRFGSMGADLYRRARGLDDRPVETSQVTKSISQEITFERDIVDGRRLRTTLMNMSEQVAYRLRQKGLCASTVRIKIRWPDFQTHTRQVTLAQPTDQDSVIAESALTLFEQIWQSGRAVRLLGVGASGLSDCAHQLSLWETGGDKERRLLEAMDELRERYGRSVVKKGSNLKGKG